MTYNTSELVVSSELDHVNRLSPCMSSQCMYAFLAFHIYLAVHKVFSICCRSSNSMLKAEVRRNTYCRY